MKADKLIPLLLMCLLVSLGCDESNPPDPPPPRRPGSITLSINTDTLRFLPGDSAATTVTIIVLDMQGNVLEGQRVALSLSEVQLGYMEYLDLLLRDTTNAQGRVDLRFTAIGIEGDEIISADVSGLTATKQLSIRVIPTVIEVDIELINPPAGVGAELNWSYNVLYTLTDTTPLANRQLSASAWGCLIDSLPRTDASGQTVGNIIWSEDYGYIILISVTDGFAVGRDSTVISIGGD